MRGSRGEDVKGRGVRRVALGEKQPLAKCGSDTCKRKDGRKQKGAGNASDRGTDEVLANPVGCSGVKISQRGALCGQKWLGTQWVLPGKRGAFIVDPKGVANGGCQLTALLDQPASPSAQGCLNSDLRATSLPRL